MREAFKKCLAGTLGVYLGLVLISHIDSLVSTKKKSEETEMKQEDKREEA